MSWSEVFNVCMMLLRPGSETDSQLKPAGRRLDGIKHDLDGVKGKVQVCVRSIYLSAAPSGGRTAQHPCQRDGNMEVTEV